ncbi:nickel/cobalt transporter [Vibrio tubiashii]|uniref:nickel/cobalt transporter n=1 Tax=Vibrio tubiashii TaxID=29498 RepID=UPI00349EBE04
MNKCKLLYVSLAVASIYLLATYWPVIMVKAIQWQRILNHELAELIYDIEENKQGAMLWFIGVSFCYGILHSLGAGHGKVLVSSYLITNRGTVSKAMFITVTTAMLQACVAIIIVEFMLAMFSATMREVHSAIASAIRISYFCVICLGVVLMVKAASKAPLFVNKHGLYGIIAAVGLRPCTGAVMILLFSNMVGLRGVGVISAIMMAFGTAITTSIIACLAVKGKDSIAELIPSKHPFKAIQFIGGAFVALFGYLLLTTKQYATFIQI